MGFQLHNLIRNQLSIQICLMGNHITFAFPSRYPTIQTKPQRVLSSLDKGKVDSFSALETIQPMQQSFEPRVNKEEEKDYLICN